MTAKTWLQACRPRVYVLFMSQAAGGQQALDHSCVVIARVVQERGRFPPTKISELLGCLSPPKGVTLRGVARPTVAIDVLADRDCADTCKLPSQSEQVRQKYNLPSVLPAYTGRMLGVPRTMRMEDVIVVCWVVFGRHQVPEGRSCFIDLSQCVSREAWSEDIPSLTTRSIIFDMVKDKRFEDWELWVCQGLPLELYPLSEQCRCVSSMIGEAMFLPSCATVLAASYFNPYGPWWQRRTD